jgi:hypothetical protein
MKLTRLIGLVGGTFTGGQFAWAGTCSLCREVLQQGGSQNLIKGYYWSIVILVGLPLIIIGIGLRYAVRRYHA